MFHDHTSVIEGSLISPPYSAISQDEIEKTNYSDSSQKELKLQKETNLCRDRSLSNSETSTIILSPKPLKTKKKLGKNLSSILDKTIIPKLFEEPEDIFEKNRNLLRSSLNLMEEFQNDQHSLNSPKIAEEVDENIKSIYNSKTGPLNYLELQQCILSSQLKISELELKIQSLNDAIVKLSKDSFLKKQNIDERICRLEEEIEPIKDFYEEKINLHKKLKKLFKLDKGDPNHSIQNFYYRTLDTLTGFALSVQALNTGMISRAPSWKDELSASIFDFLSQTAQALGSVGDMAFGAGIVIPLIALPIFATTECVWEKYRKHSKKKDFQRAAKYFSGGIDAMEHKNQCIAYGLAYLLQMQLRYCTLKGQDTILKNWLYRLCYNLMKNKKNHEEKIEEIFSILLHIDEGEERKKFLTTSKRINAIETYEDRNWRADELFEQSGITYKYYKKNNLKAKYLYQSYDLMVDFSVIKKVTNPQKYGYLHLQDSHEAHLYKRQIDKKNKGKNIWKKRKTPEGPVAIQKNSTKVKSNFESSCDESALN